MKRYRFLDERKFRFFCDGLTLESRDMAVLDHALVGLDATKHIPSLIVEHNQRTGFGPPPKLQGGQIIAIVDKMHSPTNGPLSTTTIIADSKMPGASPALHINLHSPVLDIPQRVEIPG